MIGSGGGAFAAAIAARRKGNSVVMIERGAVGGTCVNVGCVPSKALLAAAEARHVAAAQAFPGITTDAGPVDMQTLIAGKDRLVEGLRAEKYLDLAADYGWEIVRGNARFVDGPALQVAPPDGGSRRIEAQHFLVATGSSPWLPPVDGLADAGYLTSTTAVELDRVPESLLVLGGGYVGLEQAQLFARLGAKVTVLVRGERLARAEEPRVSEAIAGVFADEGITVVTGAQLGRVHRSSDGEVTATAAVAGAERAFSAEHVLVAMGRHPVTEGLNLPMVGVKLGDRGQVMVDEYLRTDNPRIWAAGDVTGYPQFVYVAAAHGNLVADNALAGAERTVDYTALPRVTFTTPAIASVGLTDAQAVAAGYRCQCRVLPLAVCAACPGQPRHPRPGQDRRRARHRPHPRGAHRRRRRGRRDPGRRLRRVLRHDHHADGRHLGAVSDHGRSAETRRADLHQRRVETVVLRRLTPPLARKGIRS